jgi:RecB family exonuclease
LVAAQNDGVAWHDMAVVTPRSGVPVGRAVVRALGRRGIPVRIRLADGEAEPVVRRVRELLAAEPPDDDAGAALDNCLARVMAELLAAGDLVAPEPSLDRAIDALVAFGRGATAWAEQQLRGTATVAALRAAVAERDLLDVDTVDPDGSVAVVTADEGAGRHWQRAVLTSCVEGEYPRGRGSVAWFDEAITLTAPLGDERGRFALAESRADNVVFVAAPQPGVLVSRYVEDLPAHEPRPGWSAPSNPTPKTPTVTTVPIHPSGQLRLSASQLSTYENCPRRWFYGNVLRLHDSTSVWADFGNLVHDVLEKFLAPGSVIEYSLDALLDLAEEMWTDDVAQFAPQRTQARREMREVLENWWSMEGSLFDRAQVVDVEHEFDFAVGDHHVRGFIDRVDRDPDRGGVAVVDYKTGGRTPSEADVEDDVQLAVYYLAAQRSPELAAIGPPTRLELRYIRVSKTFTQAITADHEVRAEQRILEAAQQMLDESLDPLPTADCDHCDYHRLCPLQRAGREAGATR